MKENIGFIGAGNMAQALIEGWLSKQLVTPGELFATNRTPGKLQRLKDEFQVGLCATNEELVDKSDVVIIAVKPQDIESAVEPIASSFSEDQVVVSLAAGIQLRRLRQMIPQCKNVVRVMANTPARINRGTFGYCTPSSNIRVDRWMERMFKPLGFTIKLEEGDQFEAFTVATSSGVGFLFEMMIYWQEWLEERGIDSADAQAMTVHTFLGAAELALKSMPLSLNDLQAKVTSKKGVTLAGLESMRELEVERLLRYSFEKAAMRDRELSQG
jgi:pyrroline-5-carboxylate reductase